MKNSLLWVDGSEKLQKVDVAIEGEEPGLSLI